MATELITRIENLARDYLNDNFMPGHGFSHSLRVRGLCLEIAKREKVKVNFLVLEASALLHDLARAAEQKGLCADHARESARLAGNILSRAGFPMELVSMVQVNIKGHRYSDPDYVDSWEGKILRDADRLDICGAVGIAMTFSFGGAAGRELYDLSDPFAGNRDLNDGKFCLDHFYVKILNLYRTMNTGTGKKIAAERLDFVRSFLSRFEKEINF